MRSTESLPSLPLRPLPSPAALAPPLRTNQPSSPGGGGHTWQLPGPPPSAPPSSHVQNPTYNPQTYGLMPSVQHLHEGRSWNQNGQAVKPDASKWGLNYNPNYAQNMDHSSKPLLPVRCYIYEETSVRVFDLLLIPNAVHSRGQVVLQVAETVNIKPLPT